MTMATGGANYSTAGTARFNQLQFLLNQGCTTLLRGVVRHIVKEATPDGFTPSPWSLHHFLAHDKQTIKRRTDDKPSKLMEEHERILYPTDGSESNLDCWDLTLLVRFIKHACRPPPTLRMDIDQVKRMRDKISHRGDTNIDETFYELCKDTIDVIMDRTLKMLNDDELSKCIGELKVIAHAEVPRNANLVPILNQLCEGNDKMHKKLDSLTAGQKEMLSILRRLDPEGKREMDIYVHLHDCPENQKEDLSKKLAELIDPKVRNNAKLNSELSPESMETLKTIAKDTMKEICTNGRTVVSAASKCVVIRMRCETIGDACDLFEQIVDGELTRMFLPVQTFVRTLPGYEKLKIEVHVTENAFWSCIQKAVNELVRSEQEISQVDYEPVDSCIKNVTAESYGPSEDKRIKIHIKPSSKAHLQHIKEICSSGKLDKNLAEIANILQTAYGSNLTINAELEESSLHIGTGSNITATKNRLSRKVNGTSIDLDHDPEFTIHP